MSCEIESYNRCLKKEIPIISKENYNIVALDKDTIINDMKKKVSDFFHQKGVHEIPLGIIEAEKIMEDYFMKKPPFEDQKPYEFKDAIMIYAIKDYLHKSLEPIVVVSGDDGFLNAFSDMYDITTFKDLESFLKYANDDIMQEAIDKAVDNGVADEILLEKIQSLSVFCDEVVDFECEKLSIEIVSCSSSYIDVEIESNNNDKSEKYYTVVADVSVNVRISSIISYLDEDMSYYDKEEERYLFEKRLAEERIDNVDINIPLEFEILLADGKATIEQISQAQVKPEPYIEINDYTCETRYQLEEKIIGEENIDHCSQCGSIIKKPVSFYTYKMEPLCSKCMQDDSDGSVCSECGYKFPHSMMINGFCKNCEQDKD